MRTSTRQERQETRFHRPSQNHLDGAQRSRECQRIAQPEPFAHRAVTENRWQQPQDQRIDVLSNIELARRASSIKTAQRDLLSAETNLSQARTGSGPELCRPAESTGWLNGIIDVAKPEVVDGYTGPRIVKTLPLSTDNR